MFTKLIATYKLLLVVGLSSVSWADEAEITCLAMNIYHEARGESFEGQLAVAFVTWNRVLSPRFPDTFCKAIQAPGAFCWTRDSIPDTPNDKAAYSAIYKLSEAFYNGAPFVDPTYGATYYHTKAVRPCWLPDAEHLVDIGYHRFYTVDSRGTSCWRKR